MGEILWLDSNNHTDTYSSFDARLAMDAVSSLSIPADSAFEKLQEYYQKTGDWIFGYLSYDLKNDLEDLASKNVAGAGFPELYFFQPRKIISMMGSTVEFSYFGLPVDEIRKDFKTINELITAAPVGRPQPVKMKLRIFKDEYFRRFSRLLGHIHRGDIYEVNFCQEFYAEGAEIDPWRAYRHLNGISSPPFAAFFKSGPYYLLSASPERYLKKQGDTLISQPIKGTARRVSDPREDQRIRERLEADPKERSENVMIVDLVRNDLSKHAIQNSVVVEELCKVYTYQQVHQMISTISAKVDPEISPVRLLRDSFPMGSMTGAPKVAAMKLIEAMEASKRGLYSGAIGYISPAGDFDFNVVIRSIVYNRDRKYVSCSVGSAITAKASPENEYQECLLKAKAMRQVLEQSN